MEKVWRECGERVDSVFGESVEGVFGESVEREFVKAKLEAARRKLAFKGALSTNPALKVKNT